jgi:invasion protein IalB
MNISIKQIFFIFFGLAAIIVTCTLLKSNIVRADKKDSKKFDDWIVVSTVENNQTPEPKIFVLSQQLHLTQKDKEEPIALFQVGYFGEEKQLKMIQTLPLGLRLEAGTSILSSQKLIVPGKYTTCTQTGCQAVATISDLDLKILLATKENSLVFMDLEGKQLALPISVKGLDKGLEYINSLNKKK